MIEGTAAARYEALKPKREPYLRRARKASELTIPSLVPPEGWTGTEDLYTPWQGVGSRGVNHLSAKLMLAMMPANTPFFRQKPSEAALADLAQKDPKVRAVTEKKLSAYERSVMGEIENSGDRAAVGEASKHLLVAGNVMLDMTGEQTIMRPLSTYVVARDGEGTWTELVFVEVLAPATAPDVVKELLGEAMPGDDKTLEIYTHARRVGDWIISHQEVSGKVIPDSDGRWKASESPYVPLRFTRIDGEDYGRGFVEEIYGDLNSLEVLMEAIVGGAAAAAKIVFFVKPNGTTRVKAVKDAKNGGFVEGTAEDVTTLQLEKYADFRVALELIERIERRLSEQFLLNSTVQRNGERVTAEEIRYLANELEDAKSGLYSILSVEFQLPYIKRKIAQLTKAKKIPALPPETVKTTIITGLEALGRGRDLQQLELFIAGLRETFGEAETAKVIDLRVYAMRRATALGIDADELIKDPDTIQTEEQQQQMTQMAQQVGPGVAQEMMKNAQ